MIYHNHPDNVLASCSREMLRLLRRINEKSQKRLERQECVTDGQMYSQAIAYSLRCHGNVDSTKTREGEKETKSLGEVAFAWR